MPTPDLPTAAESPAPTASPRMRQQVLLVAEDLYVLRGYNGFSFAHIAQAVQTTRANIHHHFGDKRQLMAELIDKFASDAERRIAHHWVEGDASFSTRMHAQLDDLRVFHRRFNPKPGSRHVWSPLSRLRLDLPVLGELAAGALHRVDNAYERSLGAAMRAAKSRGELAPAASTEDVARVLRMMLLSCAPMTQDTGDFSQIEQLFASMERMIVAASNAPDGKRTRARAAR
ncbi:MAG: TetR/AcrR family transcriptional regulator [Burkholderiaceae bacterium]